MDVGGEIYWWQLWDGGDWFNTLKITDIMKKVANINVINNFVANDSVTNITVAVLSELLFYDFFNPESPKEIISASRK